MTSKQTTTPTLLNMYRDDILPKMIEEFGYKSPMQVPKLQKVVFNVGVGESLTNSNAIESVVRMISTISGQKPVVTKARNSLAGFKIREGMSIGVMATLRSKRMYEFVDRLINVALPRIRDFRGIPSKSFDGRGNYTLGISEQIIFPEIDIDKVNKISGMDITIVTSSKTDQEAKSLLKEIGLPFKSKEIVIEKSKGNISSEKNIIKEKIVSEETPAAEEIPAAEEALAAEETFKDNEIREKK